MTLSSVSSPTYKACSAQSFHAEFGVCRGEVISRLDDLNLGDIYLVKPDAKWTRVQAQDASQSAFSLDLAANLPTQDLTTLAHLIFMTTTGRRADVYATVSMGQMYIVAETPLAVGFEYVLIHIETKEVEIAPQIVPSLPMAQTAVAHAASNVVPLRQFG